MLERARLLVRNVDGASAIEDAATGEALGTARRRAPVRRWLPLPSVLEVRETEDAPLVFTVRRALSVWPRFEVCDADGRTVGSVAGQLVIDRNGQFLAALGADGVFRARDGDALAQAVRTPWSVEIRFAQAPAPDPFVRMLLLAAMLRH
jgi:hypothetical protein